MKLLFREALQSFRRSPLLSALSITTIGFTAEPATPIDFRREVQPILAEHCYACHGPDEKARKKKLRVDTKDGLAAIVTPGKVAESSLFDRITEKDSAKIMPPVKHGKFSQTQPAR